MDFTDYKQWQATVRPETRLLFLETPSNPLGEVVDIGRMADIAHSHGACLMVDNFFCTPALQQPLKLGADIVIHSATKYIDGQGRCMGGVAVARTELTEEIHLWQRAAGACMSSFNAWTFYKGLETLRLRMKGHCDNGMALAQWLDQHPAVKTVHYSGLPQHSGHELAKQQKSAFGGVLAFQVHGGQNEAWAVIDQVEIMSRLTWATPARPSPIRKQPLTVVCLTKTKPVSVLLKT